ncbi:MAG: beta-galactosidase trimerization domain-containing protein [Victivallaceae bacterium]|nr:beta-galactosidase trimerization domain-containing protein [Victivallaceae bacterium]
MFFVQLARSTSGKNNFRGINFAKEKINVEKNKFSFQQWDGQFDPAWCTGISFLWWHGKLTVFHDKNTAVEIFREAYPRFKINCQGKENGFFGVKFPWLRPLEKGFIYKFTVGINSATLPDLITVNGKIVWEQGKGEIKNDKNPNLQSNSIISFNYVPENSSVAEVAIIKQCGKGGQNKLIFPMAGFSCNYLRAWRAKNNAAVPQYREFKLTEDVVFEKIDPDIACEILPQFTLEQVKYSKPALETENLPYAASEVVIFQLYPIPGQLKRNAIKGISTQKLGKNSEILPILKDEKIKYILIILGNVGRFLLDKKYNKLSEQTDKVVIAAKKYLSGIPDSQVYIFFIEDTGFCYGTWPHGIECSPILYLPQYRDKMKLEMPNIRNYDNMTWFSGPAKVFKAFPVIQDYLSKFYQDIKNKIGYEGRVHIVLLTDKPHYQPAYLYNAGVDILMNKHIHRQNVNITIATNRGESLTYGKKYAFNCDLWDRYYWYGYRPEVASYLLKNYFHAGGSYFWNEISTIINNRKYVFSALTKINTLGAVHFDFCRYTATHPKLGEQKSLIGIMRGSGDEWGTSAIAGPSSNESQPLGAEWKRRLFRDFNLLNVVFPNYGNYYRTFTDRLCTGTPYGPVNMIPWDIPLDKLKKYKVVFFLGGPNAMNEKQYENLKKYVENGGILVMAAGQLKKEDGSFYKTDLSDLFGVRPGAIRRLHYPQRETLINEDPKEYPYTYLDVAGNTAEVRFRLTDSSPWVVENRLGKGKAYLFSTEHLTQYGDAPAMDIMKSELEKTKWLTFSPESSWLEYMVQKKGDCYILPMFNHGNIGFPSGNGRKTGPWTGKVVLDLDKFNFSPGRLAVYESVYVPDEKIPYKLVPVKSVQENGKLSFDIKIDKFSEIVIGPADKIKNDYFSKKL